MLNEPIATEVLIRGEHERAVVPRDEIQRLLEANQLQAVYKLVPCVRELPEARPRRRYLIKGPFLADGRPTAEAVITSSNPDRDGDIVNVMGGDFENYVKNPVVLPMHVKTFPVGFAEEIRVYSDRVWARWQWLTDQPDTQAATFQRLWDDHVLNATSIGFIPRSIREAPDGFIYDRWEMVEFSPVVIPANAEAMRTSWVRDALESYEEMVAASGSPVLKSLWQAGAAARRPTTVSVPVLKGAIPYARAHPNGTPKAPEDEPWDGAAEVAAADVDDLRVMCAWVDGDAPDLKTSYKLPHHRARGHAVVWNGVRAAMGSLFGARGGVSIPDSDWDVVYGHLAKHYREFDKVPPEKGGTWDQTSSTAPAKSEPSADVVTLSTVDDVRVAFAAGVVSAEALMTWVTDYVRRLEQERDAAVAEAATWQAQAAALAAGVVLGR